MQTTPVSPAAPAAATPAPVSQAPANQTPSDSSSAGPPSAAAGISTDYQMFLKMLTTQMQNQDPLNPIESSDYAVQLATFSGVEQQTRTNTLLEDLGGRISAMGMGQLAGWVGMEARSASALPFDGTTPVSLAPAVRPGATHAAIVAHDAGGAEVWRGDLPSGTRNYDWTGRRDDGSTLPPGSYSFSLESYSGTDLLGVDPVEGYARVDEVRIGSGGSTLLLDGGSEVAASAVTALRQPR